MADILDFNNYQPYMALRWLLENRRESQFLGNPTRHFQHLSTRMSGPRKELRIYRAWACFYISKLVLPKDEFPEDAEQISKELLIIPTLKEVFSKIKSIALINEEDHLKKALNVF